MKYIQDLEEEDKNFNKKASGYDIALPNLNAI